jgi:hypothetical protein
MGRVPPGRTKSRARREKELQEFEEFNNDRLFSVA